MISIIIPTFNRAAYLGAAINSALIQSYRDFEIIVVDDASTDNTKEVIRSFGSKVHYIFQENRERAAARNNGLRKACGDFIAFLDSDDLWAPEHLATCVETFKTYPKASVVYTRSIMIDEQGAVIEKLPFSKCNGLVFKKIVAGFSSGGCNASSCMIKREAFKLSGYFNETRDLSGSEDWEMWARLAQNSAFYSSDKVTAHIRFHAEKSSLDADKMSKSMKLALDLIIEKYGVQPGIAKIKNQAYGNLYCLSAINYYASGDMRLCRRYLLKALQSHPYGLVSNKNIAYTYLRSCLGRKISSFIRNLKWRLKKHP